MKDFALYDHQLLSAVWLQTKMDKNSESAKITESVRTDQGHKFTVFRGIRPILAKHRIEVSRTKEMQQTVTTKFM